MRHLAELALSFLLPVAIAAGQDLSPLKNYHVWLPMAGMTDRQLEEAATAGYNAVLIKAHPPVAEDGNTVDFAATDRLIARAREHGFKVIPAILGWVGLGQGAFWDTDANGRKIPNRLDPFWPGAMQRVEWYFSQVIDHYAGSGDVVAFAPTWGIYGEAGFTSFAAGRSRHALDRFNEWRESQRLDPLNKLPTRQAGPNTEFNRFIRFRYLYMEDQFDAMIRRLKSHADGKPVGTWQELYPVIGYLYNMVEVPSADFALYESCFPFQTSHHPEITLAETMGFRYRCRSAVDYRNYYLPLLARKRGEGQRFMGCQLSNSYAVKNYGWTERKARRVGFDRWEDEFGPHLKRLLDTPLEVPHRDVLLVFPSYAAAALTDRLAHSVDTMFVDILLRMFGCQMLRVGSPRFDKLSVADLNRYRLIVVPCSAYLIPPTYEKLRQTKAAVLFTGCFAQSFDAERTAFGEKRTLDDVELQYVKRPAGPISVTMDHLLTRGLRDVSASLPDDESFVYSKAGGGVRVLARCGDMPVLSIRNRGRWIFVHGHLFAGLAYDESRTPPTSVSGSADPSADEHDPWGPHSSTNPQNAVGRRLMRNILDHAKVDYRVIDPPPRTMTRYLGDHMEAASISANIAYNNTSQARTITVRLPYRPTGYEPQAIGDRYQITIPPFGYMALRAAESEARTGKTGQDR